LNSLSDLYKTLILPEKLYFIRTYKLSQDHLELLFGSIKSQGGHNNPTAKQFRSGYRKLVIHSTSILQFNTGNCIPLDDVEILHYSSKDPIKVINESSVNINYDPLFEEENDKTVDKFINDHNYVVTTKETFTLSHFSKEIIIYIARFVTHKLSFTLHCEACVSALFTLDKEDFMNSLITLKNRYGNNGRLCYLSEDVITVCYETENVLKSFDYKNKSVNKLLIQSKVLSRFIGNPIIFNSFKCHNTDSQNVLVDHIPLLIKSITITYCKLKIKYSIQSQNEKPSLRSWYNKLTLFKGQ